MSPVKPGIANRFEFKFQANWLPVKEDSEATSRVCSISDGCHGFLAIYLLPVSKTDFASTGKLVSLSQETLRSGLQNEGKDPIGRVRSCMWPGHRWGHMAGELVWR